MYEILSQLVMCPYCGEQFEALVDTSQVDSEYTEDCYVCCQPIVFTMMVDENNDTVVHLHSENDVL